jgi:hypothetical protein
MKRTRRWQSVDNLRLLDRDLQHILFELARPLPNFFYLGRQCHQVLLRSLVEALRGSANLAITHSGSRKNEPPNLRVVYQLGNNPELQINPVPVVGCTKAWRFSSPTPSTAPAPPGSPAHLEPFESLVSFYRLLAMAQADCFMCHYVHSRPVAVSDQDMSLIEWLHEHIRNEFEHFVPKSYLAPVANLVAASRRCIGLAEELLFECNATNPALFPRGIATRLRSVGSKLGRVLS